MNKSIRKPKPNKILYRNAIESWFFGYYRAMMFRRDSAPSKGGAGVNAAKVFSNFRDDFGLNREELSDNTCHKIVNRMTKEFIQLKRNQNDD